MRTLTLCRYWRSVAVAGAIAYACLLRESNIALPPIQGADKCIHALMYLVFALVLQWDSKTTIRTTTWQWWLIIVCFPVIYGGVIELLQEKFFPPRTGDWVDWAADCVGVIIGLIMWWIGNKWHERRMDK